MKKNLGFVFAGIMTLMTFSTSTWADESCATCEPRRQEILNQIEELQKQLAEIDRRESVITLVTSKRARFTRMADGWTVAPDGTRWSSNQGQRDNVGSDDHGIVTDSKATRACDTIAAKLPTKEQYEKFKKYFELDTSGYLTDRGRKDLVAVFPDMKNADGTFKWYWSSSLHPYSTGYAFHFSGFDGDLYHDYREDDAVFVRCVQTR